MQSQWKFSNGQDTYVLHLIIILIFSGFLSTVNAYTPWSEFPTDFDEITNETFASGNLTVGWLKMYQCQGGTSSNTWTGPWPDFSQSFHNFAKYGENTM